VFNSNVQPKRRMKERPGPWHCNCRKPLGPYKLNSAHLNRCPVCGVARHRDPTVAANLRLPPPTPASDGAGTTSPPQRHALVPAIAGDDGPSIHRWENEGGSYSKTDVLDLEVDGSEKSPAGLEWYTFLSRYFPDRLRHDLEALKAYEAYRSAAVAPSISQRGRPGHARSSRAPRIRAGSSFTVVGRVPIASVP
jgi:hypothetical protein